MSAVISPTIYWRNMFIANSALIVPFRPSWLIASRRLEQAPLGFTVPFHD